MLWWTLRRLRSKHRHVRIEAIRKLASFEDPRVVPTLLSLLSDEEVRPAAIAALVRIGASAVEPLVDFLRDPSRWVDVSSRFDTLRSQAAACEALGAIRDSRATEAIVAFLPGYGTAAYEALGQIGDPRAVPALVRELCWRPGAESESHRDACIRALIRLGAASVDAVLPLLHDRNPAWGATTCNRGGAAKVLLGLRWEPPDQTSHALLLAFTRRYAEAAECGVAAVPALLAAIGDGAGQQAKDALVVIGAAAIEPLTKALRTGTISERKAALQALESLGWKPQDAGHRALKKALSRGWDSAHAIEGASRLGETAIDLLVAALRQQLPGDELECHRTRSQIARELGLLGIGPAAPPLLVLAIQYRNAFALDELAKILATDPAEVPLETLHELAGLAAFVTVDFWEDVNLGDGEGRWFKKSAERSTSEIRSRAQVEIDRRAASF